MLEENNSVWQKEKYIILNVTNTKWTSLPNWLQIFNIMLQLKELQFKISRLSKKDIRFNREYIYIYITCVMLIVSYFFVKVILDQLCKYIPIF